MFTRRASLALILAAPLALAGAPVFAATSPAAYTPAAFAEAQQAGKPILVEIHADWCPVCAAQVPILDALLGTEKFRDVMVFRVDFDSQKDAVRRFGARTQSTLIVFRGEAEKGRSVGDTDTASIEALLARAL